MLSERDPDPLKLSKPPNSLPVGTGFISGCFSTRCPSDLADPPLGGIPLSHILHPLILRLDDTRPTRAPNAHLPHQMGSLSPSLSLKPHSQASPLEKLKKNKRRWQACSAGRGCQSVRWVVRHRCEATESLQKPLSFRNHRQEPSREALAS